MRVKFLIGPNKVIYTITGKKILIQYIWSETTDKAQSLGDLDSTVQLKWWSLIIANKLGYQVEISMMKLGK